MYVIHFVETRQSDQGEKRTPKNEARRTRYGEARALEREVDCEAKRLKFSTKNAEVCKEQGRKYFST